MNTNATKMFGQNVRTDALLTARMIDACDFAHPNDVLACEALPVRQKRAILASWASDRNAVDSHPELRHPPELSAVIVYQDILHALKALDAIETAPSDGRLQ